MLTKLYLSDNQIGDNGAEHLDDALAKNMVILILTSSPLYAHIYFFTQTITTLHLYDNQIAERLQDRVKEFIELNQRLIRNYQLYIRRYESGELKRHDECVDSVFSVSSEKDQ